MNHALARLVVTFVPFCTAAFVACIDVGHDAETGCLVDQSAPGCRTANGGSATGGSSSGGTSGSAARGGTSSSGGASAGGASAGGASAGGSAGAAEGGEGGA